MALICEDFLCVKLFLLCRFVLVIAIRKDYVCGIAMWWVSFLCGKQFLLCRFVLIIAIRKELLSGTLLFFCEICSFYVDLFCCFFFFSCVCLCGFGGWSLIGTLCILLVPGCPCVMFQESGRHIRGKDWIFFLLFLYQLLSSWT